MTMTSTGLPIVFLGPSLPQLEATGILEADYRPPIRRGDLDQVAGGSVVAIIDGVFDQNLAVSPTEIGSALARGVVVYGSSSMGALRANEVPGVVGVGRVFEMYKNGEIENDDEVALLFDPDSQRALSVPLVNVRHSLDRLVEPGTLPRELGNRILRAAQRLPYPQRVYPRIIESAGLAKRPDAGQLISMLASHDLKRDDAITLLEILRGVRSAPATSTGALPIESEAYEVATSLAGEPVHFWEYGPPLPFTELVSFLKLTGEFPRRVRSAVARFLLEGNQLEVEAVEPPADDLRAGSYRQLRRSWNWSTEEEVAVSLRDLGIGTDELEAQLDEEVVAQQRLMTLAREGSPELLQALRFELFFEDLALKREAVRCISLSRLAQLGRQSGGPLRPAERARAVDTLCRRLAVHSEQQAIQLLAHWGTPASDVEIFIETVACAQRAAARSRNAHVTPSKKEGPIRRSPKVAGDRRFCRPFRDALAETRRLREVIGVTRLAIITGLGNIGIPNAQAFRPDGLWSSTVGSGKSESVAGARVGAVMEEVEKWAQERFPHADAPPEVVSSYRALQRRGRRPVDPQLLDLPYDTCYRPDLEIGWRECEDLIGGVPLLVPSAALTMGRFPNDIYYSPRGARRTFSTNGLASGFTLEEALTHAISEYIERHSHTLHNIVHRNPGTSTAGLPCCIDLDTVPPSTTRLVKKIRKAGHRLQVTSLTSAIGVPCFEATILTAGEGGHTYQDDWIESSGQAAHPDPEVAINMAILEASQTIMTATAGAREDITLHARSLGRHERSRARKWSSYVEARRPDAATRPFTSVPGFVSRDARDDVRWLRDCLARAGCPHLLFIDIGPAEIRPARVVRVVIPGLETNNPFFTGPTACMALLDDLV